MAVELIGAKLVTPLYGNSIYVWASALGFTLLGLMSGYFLGGWMSERYPKRQVLYMMVLLSGCLVALMPISATFMRHSTSGFGLKLAILLSEFFILFPPVLFFGVVSPMVIRLITEKVAEVGNAAGRIYAISTGGGILLNFLMGLYLIPFAGVRMSAWITAGLLVAFSSFFLLVKQRTIQSSAQ